MTLQMYIALIKHKKTRNLIKSIVTKISKEINKKMGVVMQCEEKKSNIMLNIWRYIKEEIHSEDENNIVETDNFSQTDKFICEECNTNFKSLMELNKHKKMHSKTIKATLCEICGKNSKNPSLLKAHINSHKQEQCPYCFKVLKKHAHFEYHIRKHETGASKVTNYKTIYKCNDCNYESSNKTSLEAHINKKHLNIRPFVCQICYKGFFKKSNLVEHASVHRKIKFDTCEICGDTFVNKKCLKIHLRLHSGERPYECEVCKAKFVSASRKSDHMKRSHCEKKELCVFCGKKYGLKNELNRHMKRKHMYDADILGDNIFDSDLVPNILPDLGGSGLF